MASVSCLGHLYDVPDSGSRVSIVEAIHAARQAGFTGPSLIRIVAIAMAESGLQTNSAHCNDVSSAAPGSLDQGILQINSTNTINPSVVWGLQSSFDYAYALSSNGVNLSPWSTYSASGASAHQQFIPSVIEAASNPSLPSANVSVPNTPPFVTNADTGTLGALPPVGTAGGTEQLGFPISLPNPLGGFNPIGDLLGFLGGQISIVTSAFKTIGVFVIGAIAIAAGLIIIASGNQTIVQYAKTAAEAAVA